MCAKRVLEGGYGGWNGDNGGDTGMGVVKLKADFSLFMAPEYIL